MIRILEQHLWPHLDLDQLQHLSHTCSALRAGITTLPDPQWSAWLPAHLPADHQLLGHCNGHAAVNKLADTTQRTES